MPWRSTTGVDSKVSYGDFRTAISNYAATRNPVYNNAKIFYATFMIDDASAVAGTMTNGATFYTGSMILATGNIILRNASTDKVNNGLWVVQSTGSAIRYDKANTALTLGRSYTIIRYAGGTSFAGNIYYCTNAEPNIGVDAIDYVQKYLPSQSLETTDSPTFANITVDGTTKLGAVETSGLATLGTAKIGDVSGGNYTEFEANGTLLGHGDATCYMDVIIPMFLRGVAAEPEVVAFPLNGVGLQPRFRVNDILTLQNAEAPHDWEEGSGIEIHIHYSNGSEDTTDRYIKFTLEYAIANMVANGNTGTQFVRGTEDVEWAIPANTPAYTHLYKTLKVVDATTMANIKIGAGFVGSLKRITATGTAPSVNPYVLNLGIHYKTNTLGSRTTTSK
jgi:hypothetical protein